MKYASTGLPAAYHKKLSGSFAKRRSERGFTLLETLVAITILAIALTSLFQAYATGITALRASDDYTRAQMLAQSLLAETSAKWRYPLQASNGSFGKFRWQVLVLAAPSHLPATIGDGQWQLSHVVAVISWRPGRVLRLETLKLARAAS